MMWVGETVSGVRMFPLLLLELEPVIHCWSVQWLSAYMNKNQDNIVWGAWDGAQSLSMWSERGRLGSFRFGSSACRRNTKLLRGDGINCDPSKWGLCRFAWEILPHRSLWDISFVAMKMSPSLPKIIFPTDLVNYKFLYKVFLGACLARALVWVPEL